MLELRHDVKEWRGGARLCVGQPHAENRQPRTATTMQISGHASHKQNSGCMLRDMRRASCRATCFPPRPHAWEVSVSAAATPCVFASCGSHRPRPLQVVAPADGSEAELPYTSHGVSVNSSSDSLDISGQPTAAAGAAVIAWLESAGAGTAEINYKLRDWLFARQRYWGEPFPVVYPEGSDEVVAVPEDQLPVTLPDMDDFKPSGKPESPLVNAEEWLRTTDPRTGGPARRDTNTMPQWAGSCWYYLRYIDPKNNVRCCSCSTGGAASAWSDNDECRQPGLESCR